jgi:hypothetical protein
VNLLIHAEEDASSWKSVASIFESMPKRTAQLQSMGAAVVARSCGGFFFTKLHGALLGSCRRVYLKNCPQRTLDKKRKDQNSYVHIYTKSSYACIGYVPFFF